MNKIYTFLIVAFSVTLGYAQCDDPVADAEQYFCTGSNITLDDLEVDPVSGTLAWFEDETLSNSLPNTTPVVDGETYYVINDCGAGVTSNAVPITAYEQSVEFVVSPNSCVNLGKNVFFIEEDDLTSPIIINVLNLNGDPFDAEIIWSPISPNLGYYFSGTAYYPFPVAGTLGPANPINMVEIALDLYDVHTLDLNIPVGDGCGPSDESITLIAGGLEYKGICYGVSQDLQDVFDYYEGEGVFNQEVTWYDAATGGTVLPATNCHRAMLQERIALIWGLVNGILLVSWRS